MMNHLHAETMRKLELWVNQAQNPVVLWSGGKDSNAMLHMILFGLGVKLPVIQWREPRFRHRYAFSDRLAKEWDLEVYDYAPSRVALSDGPDIETGEPRFDFLKYYQWGKSTAIILSLGTEHPKEGEPYLCGVTDVLQRPVGSFVFPWDSVFHGQKSFDVDLIKGGVPLMQDVRTTNDAPTQFFPLRAWTDADVFGYAEQYGCPIDETRYVKINGVWGHNPDKSQNADYYPICFNCVNRHKGPIVFCPKMQAEVTNISERAPYEDIVIPEQGFRPTWNDSIVNGVGHAVHTVGVGRCSGETGAMREASRLR